MKTRMSSEERRASIVGSAIHLFAEKGFRGATTRELAGALGVSEPVLYQHFANKSELYTAIIEHKVAAGRQRDVELAERLEGDDDRALFTHVAEHLLSVYDEDPEFIRLLLFSALEGHELAERFYQSQMVRFHEMLAGYLRRRIREGAFREVNPMTAAYTFIGMVSHHGLREMLFRQPVKLGRRKLIDEIVGIFLNGIDKNGASK